MKRNQLKSQDDKKIKSIKKRESKLKEFFLF